MLILFKIDDGVKFDNSSYELTDLLIEFVYDFFKFVFTVAFASLRIKCGTFSMKSFSG